MIGDAFVNQNVFKNLNDVFKDAEAPFGKWINELLLIKTKQTLHMYLRLHLYNCIIYLKVKIVLKCFTILRKTFDGNSNLFYTLTT